MTDRNTIPRGPAGWCAACLHGLHGIACMGAFAWCSCSCGLALIDDEEA